MILATACNITTSGSSLATRRPSRAEIFEVWPEVWHISAPFGRRTIWAGVFQHIFWAEAWGQFGSRGCENWRLGAWQFGSRGFGKQRFVLETWGLAISGAGVLGNAGNLRPGNFWGLSFWQQRFMLGNLGPANFGARVIESRLRW